MRGWDAHPRCRADSIADLQAVLAQRDAGAPALLPTGSGSSLSRGRPPSGPVALLDMSSMNRVVEHIPEDLTVRVEAGVTLQQLQNHLREHHQWLPLSLAGTGTIGGWIGSGRRGPLSGSWGSLRDYLIGIRFVDGQGRDLHGGGQVVKNVAGYDMMKLMTGSLGELGVVAEATFKVLPLPSCFGGVLLENPGPEVLSGVLPEIPRLWFPAGLWRMGSGVEERLVALFAGSARQVQFQVRGLTAAWGSSARSLEEPEARELVLNLEQWTTAPEEVLGWGGALPTFLTGTQVSELFSGGEWAADLLGGHLWWRLSHSHRKRVDAARRQLDPDAGHLNQDVAPGGHEGAWGESDTGTIPFFSRLKETLDPHHRLVAGRLPGAV